MLAAMDSLLSDARFLAHLCHGLTPSSSSLRAAPPFAVLRRRGASAATRVLLSRRPVTFYSAGSRGPPAVARNGALMTDPMPSGVLEFSGQALHQIGSRKHFIATAQSAIHGLNNDPNNGVYTVGDFMTKREDLHVVKPTTTVNEALQMLVENRITGFPVIDDDWKLVGVVSDYDLLALDSISGSGRTDTSMFPEVDSSWKTFNEIQRLLSKTNGKVIGELMTPAPLVVRETTNLEDAARLLLETKYRRLPVVDGAGKLIGIITRGNVVRAALEIKLASEKGSQS